MKLLCVFMKINEYKTAWMVYLEKNLLVNVGPPNLGSINHKLPTTISPPLYLYVKIESWEKNKSINLHAILLYNSDDSFISQLQVF